MRPIKKSKRPWRESERPSRSSLQLSNQEVSTRQHSPFIFSLFGLFKTVIFPVGSWWKQTMFISFSPAGKESKKRTRSRSRSRRRRSRSRSRHRWWLDPISACDSEACCILRKERNGPNVSLQAHQEPIEAKVKFQKQEAIQEPTAEKHPLARPEPAVSEQIQVGFGWR